MALDGSSEVTGLARFAYGQDAPLTPSAGLILKPETAPEGRE